MQPKSIFDMPEAAQDRWLRERFSYDHAALSLPQQRALVKLRSVRRGWIHHEFLARTHGIKQNTLDALADKRLVRYRYPQLLLGHVSSAKYWKGRQARLTALGIQIADMLISISHRGRKG